MLAFGVPLVPTTLAYWIFASSDRLVIGKLSTLDELGLYTVAITASSLLGLVNGALGQAWSPYAIKIYEEQPNESPALFGMVLTYIMVGFGLLCVFITTFAHEVLMVLSTPTFYPAAIAMGPLTLGFMAYASTQVTAIGISITKKTNYFASFSWMAAVMNLILNILLVPKWGMIAASWTTAASYTFLTIAYFMTSQRLFPVVYEKWRVLAVVGLTFGFVLLVPFLPEMTLITCLVVKIMYCLIYVSFLFVLRILDKREWQMLTSLLSKRNAVSDEGDKQVCSETQNSFTTRIS
ncbi:membrane protein [Candidatus Scalindua japonica]|uniref:Membrane protein n=2 Tax=Candidatus Scalindua japonica TaxID=1284222 RepID=A0A286U177_9BACT|nr:membrane protein [Candidatus Scalindua japonica]